MYRALVVCFPTSLLRNVSDGRGGTPTFRSISRDGNDSLDPRDPSLSASIYHESPNITANSTL